MASPLSAEPASAPFPPAPWRLNGDGVQAVFFVPLAQARKLVPASLRVRAVIPGHTLGVISAGRYDDSSTLAYSELIVSPAVVTSGDRTGFWISHIYVDSPVSQAGGRRIWNLDKHIARFDWSGGPGELRVSTEHHSLCHLRPLKTVRGWMPPVGVPAFSVHEGRSTFFRGALRSRSRFGIIRCSIPQDSPLVGVVPDASLVGCRHERASMLAEAPIVDHALA